jgi:peptidyl-prolyl cis-trans isomerase C
MMNRAIRTLTLLGLAVLAACTQKEAAVDASGKVADVNGHAISRNTYNQYVKGVAGKPAEDLTAEQRDQLLKNLIRAEIIASNAETAGIAARDETRAALDLARLQILERASQQDYLKDRPPSDEELRAEYDLQVSQMDKTQFRASHILVPTEDAAKQIIAALKGGANFAQLAKQSSVDTASKDKGGDLDWFAPSAMAPPFAEAVVKLKKGETTAAPVKSQFGYHVVRLVDTRDVAPPPFESVRDRLVELVQQKKYKAYVDGLETKAKVTKTP